ncbi:hypothetical protein J3A83DRAFT_120382 [Scleroderma citrinum]
MAHITQIQPFALQKLCGSLCFCGVPTTAEHEFCFCSTECSRADALRALDASESHYRKVFQRACVGPPPGLRRQASAGLLPNPHPQQGWAPRLQRSKHVKPAQMRPDKPQHNRNHLAHGTRPTLEQVTDAVLAKKTRTGEDLARSNYEPQRWNIDRQRGNVPEQRVNEGRYNYVAPAQISLYAIPMPEDGRSRPTLRRAQPSTTGLKDNFHKSVAQLFHSGKGKSPENAFERNFQPYSEPEAPGWVFGHPADPQYLLNKSRAHPPRPLPPVPPVVRPLPSIPAATPPSCTPTGTRKSRAVRRSASFAGWNSPPDNSVMGADETLMHAFNQVKAELSAVGDEDFDPRDYFKADEDDM